MDNYEVYNWDNEICEWCNLTMVQDVLDQTKTSNSNNGVSRTTNSSNGLVQIVTIPLCPDLLRYDHLGVADNLRGRIVRAFFWLMRIWSV